jgi:signal transduction histidine kinase/ABC-type amino acid transport substrate-binding protein
MNRRYIQKILLFFLIPLSFTIIFMIPQTVQAQNRTVRVGAYNNPPKIYPNEKGQYTGFFPTIVNYIADQEGWTIDYVPGTWDECLERLEAGDIDMMVDVAWDTNRATRYQFNDVAVIENWGTIYSQKGLEIFSLSDLEGLTIAVMAGNIHTEGENGIKNLLLRTNITCTYFEVGSNQAVFEAVDNGTADVGVVNRLYGLSNEHNYNVQRTPIYFNPVDLKFAFPKNATQNAYLISRIDYQLIKMKEDPKSIYYSALEQYILGSSVIERTPEWVYWVISIAIGLVCLFSFMSAFLKKTVNNKTLELRQANKNLELAEETLLNTIPTGIIEIDHTGKIRTLNAIFQQLYKEIYQVDLTPGIDLFSLAPNDLLDTMKQIFSGQKSENHPDNLNHITVSLPNKRHFEIFHAIVQDISSDVKTGHIFVFHDVTPFIELEQMRKQFISTVSHELRTPIASINLTLENLVQYKDKIRPDQRDYMLGLMVKSGKVLAEMIEDLLISSRIEGNRLSLTPTDTDLVTIIDDVVLQLAGKINEKNVSVVKSGLEKCVLNVDPKRIGQVFRVLLDNAIKYSPAKSVVEVELKGPGVHQIKGNTYEGCLVRITDHGMGIPAKDQPKLFNKFFRASNVGNIVGTGLGLTIAKEIVELHNGKLFVESQEGQGTTFFIVFAQKKSEESA